jgi:hypothetical protein
VFCISVQLFAGTFLILRRILHDTIVNVRTPSGKVPDNTVRFLIKLEFSQQIFKKFSNTKFHENRSSRSHTWEKSNQHCCLSTGKNMWIELIMLWMNQTKHLLIAASAVKTQNTQRPVTA